MKTTKVLFGIFLLALLLLWLTGCGYRRTTIVLPDENGQEVTLAGKSDGKPVVVKGRAVIVETYGVTSESVIDAGNAADRLQFSGLCSDARNANLEVCKTYGTDRAPSDSPKEGGYYYRGARRRGHYGHYPCYMTNIRGECIPWKRY